MLVNGEVVAGLNKEGVARNRVAGIAGALVFVLRRFARVLEHSGLVVVVDSRYHIWQVLLNRYEKLFPFFSPHISHSCFPIIDC